MLRNKTVPAPSCGDQIKETLPETVSRDVDIFLVQCVKRRGFKTPRQLFDWLLDLSKGFYRTNSAEIAAWLFVASLRVHTVDFEKARGGNHE